MAMMITRFHKLIQSKTVWYIVLGVIVITFVGFFTPTMDSGARRQKEGPAGELFGKKVSRDEYRRAWHNSYVWYVLSSGRMIPMTDELDETLREEAWRRVAVLRKAQEEKIPVADQEVVRQMHQMPVFSGQNGFFSPEIYRAVLQQIGLTPRQAEELFREQIAIYKLMIRPAQAALISPRELKQAYHLYTDRFVIDYAVVPRAQAEVEVSREEAMALFAENPQAFRMPAKVRVSYVEFPVSGFIAQAEVPEGAALEAYTRNLENYRVQTDGGEAEHQGFEQVEAEITEQIRQAVALRMAAEKASEFVVAAAPKADGAQAEFSGAAAAAGLKIKTLPAFGPQDELKGIDPTAPFRRAAFRLENDAYGSFSDAVIGKDTVYVLSLEQHYPSFIPAFDAVEEEAMKAARERAAARALTARARDIQDAAEQALEAGTGLREAVRPFGLRVQTTPEFDLSSELDDPYADTLIRLCLNVQQGGLCEPASVKEGVLLAQVVSRTATDMDIGFAALREELVAGLSRNRAQRLASAWQEALLEKGALKDLLHK